MAPDSVPRTLISGNLELPWESLSSMGYVMASYGLIISACGLSLRRFSYFSELVSTMLKSLLTSKWLRLCSLRLPRESG